MSDEEIVDLFNKVNISESLKDKLFVVASERINHLSTTSFIKVSTWASSVEEYKKYYFSKIEKMTYEEFLSLIEDGIYEPSILIAITETNVYKQYLEQEKREQKRNNLQCCDLQIHLIISKNSLEFLNSFSKIMLNLLKNAIEKNKNLEMLEKTYLDAIIENIDSIDLESDSIKVGFAIMNLQMKRHKVITDKMIEFYLHVRIKELGLKDVCKNIIVTLGESIGFGHYTLEGDIQKDGTLKIYSEYLKTKFEKYKKEFTEEGINDVINLNYFRCLSHECEHALKMKKFKPLMENLDAISWFKEIASNKELNYYYRNQMLHYNIGDKIYNSNHRIFINEMCRFVKQKLQSNDKPTIDYFSLLK